MKMLLSINPQHVENILAGTKRYEFRKVRTRHRVSKILIYSTAPVGLIVGEVEVLGTLDGSPDEVWQQASDHPGITREFFDGYYHGRNRAIAYELGGVEIYAEPKRLVDFGVLSAPQSFVYVS
jgi:predicted transcriptional regulator